MRRRRDATKQKAYNAAYREANIEKLRISAKARYAANREKNLARQAAYYEKNRAAVRAYQNANPDIHARYRAANPEKILAQKAAYRATNAEKIRAYNARKYVENSEDRRARSARWRELNPVRCKASLTAYRKANLEKYSAKEAKRRAVKRSAIPAWANEFFIEEAYDLARRRTVATGFEWHVDHIVPLQSHLVCGLHVENNLQVIPATKNISKGNRYWPNMPEAA